MITISVEYIKQIVGENQQFTAISCHKNVILLIGDRSQPKRTIDWIDSLSPEVCTELIAVHDWKGGLTLFWSTIPETFVGLYDVTLPDTDVWMIYRQEELGNYSKD